MKFETITTTDNKGNQIQYRLSSYFDRTQKYLIEKKINDGRWKFQFGGLDYLEAKKYMDNPTTIDIETKHLHRTGIFIIIFIIVGSLFYLISNS